MEMLVNNTVPDIFTNWVLRESHCGFDGNTPKVCCPIYDQNDKKVNLVEPATQSSAKNEKMTSTTVLPLTTTTLPPTTTSLPPTTSTLPQSTAVTNDVNKIRRIGLDNNYNLVSLVNETCKTVYNTTGSCTDLYLCKPFLALAQLAQNNPAAAITLKQAHCGFSGTMPKVCCPIDDQKDEKVNLVEPATQSTAKNVKTTAIPSTTVLPPTTSTLPPTSSTLPQSTAVTNVVNKTHQTGSDNINNDILSLVGETCKTVYNTTGSCTDLYLCKQFLALAYQAKNNPAAAITLKQAHCGFSGTMPKVCCPIDDQKDKKVNLVEPATQITAKNEKTTAIPSTTVLPPTTSTLAPTKTTLSQLTPAVTNVVNKTRRTGPDNISSDLLSLDGETCKTIYNTTGSCTDLNLCKPFLEMAYQAQNNPAAAITLKQALCGFSGTMPKVCCPLPVQSAQVTRTISTELPSADLRAGDFLTALPEPPVCGTGNTSDNRVVGGVPAKLGAFPWMALLAYKDQSVASGVQWNCGGSLVSTRHVLTAAHCIHYMEDSLFLVRLGELDFARDDEGATPVDILIKDMFKHEEYTKNNPMINDIGVLVLQRDVEFTDLIRPICLITSTELRAQTFEDYNPFVAGWGDLQWNGPRATHLQVAQVPVISSEDCSQAYRDNSKAKNMSLFPAQAMCAGFMSGGIDSCLGDSGGPLMQPIENEDHKSFFYQIGVVSFGRACAFGGSPGLYARVTYYMPWIEEKLLGRSS